MIRARAEDWLLRHWYGTHRPPWYLRMLEPIYRLGFQRIQKNALDGAADIQSVLPLIVVGNITAGGSGKTPLVIRLCQLALEMHLMPGIASTGYGRKSRDTLLVEAGGDADTFGDEPILLATRTGVPVMVAARRLDAVNQLTGLNLDLIVSDDGLQQAGMTGDIEICVVDGARGLGNQHLLPAEPLREPATRLRQVDYVITNGAWHGKPDDLDVSVMQLEAITVRSLDQKVEYTVESFRQKFSGKIIHAIAGIGNPQRFFRMLQTLGIETQPHAFPDHHVFSGTDFDSLMKGSMIIMTEKDAVKCRSLGLENAWYVPVETRLPVDFESRFKTQLEKIIRGGK